MRHLITTSVEILTSPKVGWGTVLSGLGSRIAVKYQWLAENLTDIATIMSLILSVVVIASHIVKFISSRKLQKVNKEIRDKVEQMRVREVEMATEKHELEMKLLEERLRLLVEKNLDTED